MATYTGKSGKIVLNGKEFGLVDWAFDEGVVPTDESRERFNMSELKSVTGTFSGAFSFSSDWRFWLLPCKATITRLGQDFVFDGMCNEEKTRIFLKSNFTPGKYYLKHLENDGKTLRHERITHDIDDAGRWVLNG